MNIKQIAGNYSSVDLALEFLLEECAIIAEGQARKADTVDGREMCWEIAEKIRNLGK
jgi:hypothetical protein